MAQILDGFPFPADCRETIDAGCHARELAGEVSWQHVAHGETYFLGAAALLLSVFDHYGLIQRLALAGGVAWVGALALALLDLYGRQRLLQGSPVGRRANVAEGREMQSDP